MRASAAGVSEPTIVANGPRSPTHTCTTEALEDLLHRQPKSTKREISFWGTPENGSIHVAAEPGFITTVRSDPASERGDPKLFEWLRTQLEADGRPAPDTSK